MRILHTSDWHLGISTGPTSRREEQERFLDWLLDTLREREVDALVIAGDVFDSMHPSAEAQAVYYQFIARIGGVGVRDVVVVGGNHDSPSRLDAPKALLEAVDVHVIGGLPSEDERLAQMIVPLRARGSEDVAAVCLAVPYVHEYRLRIRTTDLDREKTRAAFKAAFSRLYSELVDKTEEDFPNLPILATGHLTLGFEAKREDYPQEIHQVGTIEALPAAILDPRIAYTALGHIHRCYPIAESSAWYCGTPIPYALNDMKTARQVLIVDLEVESEARVERVEVPRCRDLVQLVGSPETVLADLEGLSWSTRLPPLVHVRVQTDMVEPGLVRRLHEAVASHDRAGCPVLVEVQQRAQNPDSEPTTVVVPSLDELEPEQVFALMCDAGRLQGNDRHQLKSAFRAVASMTYETLEEMLRDIVLPRSGQGDAS